MWKPHTARTSPRHPPLFLSFLCHPYILTIFVKIFYSFLVVYIYIYIYSKLAEVQKLIEKGYEARCVEVKCKWRRRVLVQLRGGTAALEVETGRWRGVSREGRVCRNCRSEEVENVEHWLLRCTGMAEEKEKLIRTMREKVEWQSMEDDERVAAVLSYACR